MTNADRMTKLKQAEDLTREVEFSYPQGDPTRQRLYKVVVDTFSFMGCLDPIRRDINREAMKDFELNRKGRAAKGEFQRECPFAVSDFESCPECRGSFNFLKPTGAACPHCKVNIIDAYTKSDAV